MEDKNKELLNEFLDKMGLVKEEFIRLKKYEQVSIRKDVVKVELQNIINKCKTYEELRDDIQEYIDNLLKLEVKTNE